MYTAPNVGPVAPVELTPEQVVDVAPRRNALQVASALSMRSIPIERLRREIEDARAVGMTEFAEAWDLSDPAVPVATRRCRSCKVELRFPFEGGVVPLLLRYIANPACESCSDKEQAAEDAGKLRATLDHRLEKSGMPAKLAAEVSWQSIVVEGDRPEDTMQREQALEAVRAWATVPQPSPRGVLLHGAAGTGKTRLAATAALERLKHSAVQWVSVGVLMAELDAAWGDDDRKRALKILTSKEAVVLDDFDKINPTQRILGQLFTALDKREQHGAPLLVTTNLDPAGLQEKVGEVIVSRLLGMCLVRRYPGPDMRLKLGPNG